MRKRGEGRREGRMNGWMDGLMRGGGNNCCEIFNIINNNVVVKI